MKGFLKLISYFFCMNKFIINHSGLWYLSVFRSWTRLVSAAAAVVASSARRQKQCVCVVLLLSLHWKISRFVKHPWGISEFRAAATATAVCRPTWSPICIQSSVLFPRHAWSPPFILEGFSIDHVAAAAHTAWLYQFWPHQYNTLWLRADANLSRLSLLIDSSQ